MTNKEWESSSVMKEFEKKATELGWITTNLNPKDKDLVGNPSKSPVGPFRNNPIKDEKGLSTDKNPCKDYDITKETGEELIGKAHKKSPTMADAMDERALVENIIEQQKKDIEIATKMPHGAYIQTHAALIQSLVKIANSLEKQGKYKEAIKIDVVIEKLALPFVNRQAITKEALWPALILGLIGGAGTAANLGFFSSKREDLSTDIKDLYEILKKASFSPSATKAAQLIEPFVSKFQGISFKDNKDIANFAEMSAQFNPVLEQIGELVNKVELELGESRWYEFGLDKPSRIRAKYEDVVKDFEFISSRLNNISEVGQKVQQSGKTLPSGISSLQSILVENGLLESDKADGKMSQDTTVAVKNLEEWLNNRLATLGIKKSFTNKIVEDGKLVMNPEKLREIITLTTKELAK
jgi:hypothetical protein